MKKQHILMFFAELLGVGIGLFVARILEGCALPVETEQTGIVAQELFGKIQDRMAPSDGRCAAGETCNWHTYHYFGASGWCPDGLSQPNIRDNECLQTSFTTGAQVIANPSATITDGLLTISPGDGDRVNWAEPNEGFTPFGFSSVQSICIDEVVQLDRGGNGTQLFAVCIAHNGADSCKSFVLGASNVVRTSNMGPLCWDKDPSTGAAWTADAAFAGNTDPGFLMGFESGINAIQVSTSVGTQWAQIHYLSTVP